MTKESYVSEDLEKLFINDFINSEYIIDNFWIGRQAILYGLFTRIFKHQMETNAEINFNDSLELFLDNYKILKEKNLLSLEEIKSFEKFITQLPGLNLIKEKIEYSVSAEEHFMYMCMAITKYLKETSFLIDFFNLKNNIENF